MSMQNYTLVEPSCNGNTLFLLLSAFYLTVQSVLHSKMSFNIPEIDFWCSYNNIVNGINFCCNEKYFSYTFELLCCGKQDSFCLLQLFFFCISYQAHIGNILKSKFIGYKDFDTLMYTCAAEFDFMEKEVIWSK